MLKVLIYVLNSFYEYKLIIIIKKKNKKWYKLQFIFLSELSLLLRCMHCLTNNEINN